MCLTTQGVFNFTNFAQFSVSNCITDAALARIPDDLQDDLIELINRFAQRISGLVNRKNLVKRQQDESRKQLVHWGLWDRADRRENPASASTFLRRFNYATRAFKYHCGKVANGTGFKSKFVVKVFKNNPHAQSELQQLCLKRFVSEQNLLTKQLNVEYEYTSRIFFNGWLRGWNRRDYVTINKTV